MYVECRNASCTRKAWLRPGRKLATCDWCRELGAWLRKVHAKRAPVHLTDAENEQLRREERITVRVGQ